MSTKQFPLRYMQYRSAIGKVHGKRYIFRQMIASPDKYFSDYVVVWQSVTDLPAELAVMRADYARRKQEGGGR